MQRFTNQHVQDPEQEEEEHEEVFAPYKPTYFKYGADHPDPCVETTSLSFVEPPCPTLPASGAAPAQVQRVAHAGLAGCRAVPAARLGKRVGLRAMGGWPG